MYRQVEKAEDALGYEFVSKKSAIAALIELQKYEESARSGELAYWHVPIGDGVGDPIFAPPGDPDRFVVLAGCGSASYFAALEKFEKFCQERIEIC